MSSASYELVSDLPYRDGLTLRVKTFKPQGGTVRTTARVVKKNSDGTETTDKQYYEVLQNTYLARVMNFVVEEQHERHLKAVSDIRRHADEFYQPIGVGNGVLQRTVFG